MLVIGTRPEAIKICPLIKELSKEKNLQVIVCATGQHREMLKQVMDFFEIIPNYNLDIMKAQQNLFTITTDVMNGMKDIYEKEKPDMVLVHGDTTTTFASALAAYYLQIPVGHVEAGLRTYDNMAPFPEEFNRQGVGSIATWHFAPTQLAYDNLIREGKPKDDIYITGNTAIDAMKYTIQEDFMNDDIAWCGDSRMILMTAHRRENWGQPLEYIFRATLDIVEEFPDIKVIYPLHKNPAIRKMANEILGKHDRIRLIDPLDVFDFHNYMKKSYLIMTDSGGIQEEAPSLGKPVLVLRDKTERPEGIEAGTLKLIGTDTEFIKEKVEELLSNQKLYDEMSKASNPYGDGKASQRIVEIIKNVI